MDFWAGSGADFRFSGGTGTSVDASVGVASVGDLSVTVAVGGKAFLGFFAPSFLLKSCRY